MFLSFQGKDVFAVNSCVVVTWLPPFNSDPLPALPVIVSFKICDTHIFYDLLILIDSARNHNCGSQ